MDWTKAKTILIVALLVTNLFLIFAYGFGRDKEGQEIDEQTLINVLANKNIFLEVDIPPKHKDMKILSIEYAGIDEEKIHEAIERQEPVADPRTPADYAASADQFLKSCGFLPDNAKLDKVYEEKTDAEGGASRETMVVEYKNLLDGIPVEESYMRCIYKDGKLAEFERSWLNPTKLSKKKVGIVSASSALISFMGDRPKEEKVRVENIEIVYWLSDAGFSMETALSDMAFPAWKITYNGGKVKYMPAAEL